MKYVFVLATIALTIVCWGLYGPVLQNGRNGFRADETAKVTPAEIHNNSLRAFVCVGLAYFVIAVVVPISMLRMYGERGDWTAGGTLWSLIAGAAGALGALGLILSFQFGGKPIYIMPLVFGGAPVVNAVLTIYMAKAFRQVGALFLAGLIMVLIGSMTVLLFQPVWSTSGQTGGFLADLKNLPSFWILAALTMVILGWGAYGPLLHKGQLAMQSSRLRPLICVGLSYFAVAVAIPSLMLASAEPGGAWRVSGTLWSLTAGAAGAIGALGIILCFNFGGRPVYVMPLVFGGAPVVSTFAEIAGHGGSASVSPFFYAGLIVVVTGATIVLMRAPRGHAPAAVAPKVAGGTAK